MTEVYSAYTFTGSAAAIREVFERLPVRMQDVVRLAAARPDSWISYEDVDERTGRPRGTFARSFGGYHSKDPERPRPFHIGTDERGRFHLLVDSKQAAAIVG